MQTLNKQIGERLRRLRKTRRLTLDELATATGFTKSYLSKIENSKKIPPIASLTKISRALDTELTYFFQASEDPAEMEEGACVIRASERQTAVRGGTSFGYDYKSLAHRFPHKKMEPFLFTFPAHIGKEIFFEHEGEEFIFVISGRVRFLVDGREWILEPGDSIYFDSTLQHRGESVGGDAKALVVFYSPATKAGV